MLWHERHSCCFCTMITPRGIDRRPQADGFGGVRKRVIRSPGATRRQRPPTAIHRPTTRGWFPGSGAVRLFVRPAWHLPRSLWTRWSRPSSSLHYRCGGSAGFRPASQFSDPPDAGRHLERRQHSNGTGRHAIPGATSGGSFRPATGRRGQCVPERLRAVTSTSIFMRGSRSPAEIIIAAGRASPR